MKILVTGNQGYVGPVLGRHLRRRLPGAELIGFDTGYFALSTTNAAVWPERVFDRQHAGDVRELPPDLLEGVDGVVQLAAISNDPMGNRFAVATNEINCRASLRLAELAARAGVSHFVFASSCSVYGCAPGAPRRESDELDPQTAYARSKVEAEAALATLDLGPMIVTSLRFATACGMSDRLRLDLVLNDFVASAVASGRIVVLSDGTPWRPLIDLRDMARAIEWALVRGDDAGGRKLSVNVGSNDGNYRVKDLATTVAAAIPGTDISINTGAQSDTRSYRVDFSHYEKLAPHHRPQVALAQSIAALHEGLTSMGFADPAFRSSRYMRLKMLEEHIAAGRLANDLRWLNAFLERE